MKVGSVVETKGVKVVQGEQGLRKSPSLTLGYAPHKGHRFVFIYMGMRKEGEKFDAEEVLKQMGWTPPPAE